MVLARWRASSGEEILLASNRVREVDVIPHEPLVQVIPLNEKIPPGRLKRPTILGPPDINFVVRAIHSVDAPDPLFGNANHAWGVQKDHRRGALQIESFAHRVATECDQALLAFPLSPDCRLGAPAKPKLLFHCLLPGGRQAPVCHDDLAAGSTGYVSVSRRSFLVSAPVLKMITEGV